MKFVTLAIAAALSVSTAPAFASSNDLAGSYTCKLDVGGDGKLEVDAAQEMTITRTGKMISFNSPTDQSPQQFECKNGSQSKSAQGIKIKAAVKCSTSNLSIGMLVKGKGVKADIKFDLTKVDAKHLNILATVGVSQDGESAFASVTGVCVSK